MALGIPNRLIVLGVLAIAFFIPKRAEGAGTAVRSISESLSASFTALGSTKFQPVSNPTVGLSGNIGERIVSRVFDDPTPAIEIPGVVVPAVPAVEPPAVPAVEPPATPAIEVEPTDEDPYPIG